jgi:hypothetical protein
MSRPTVQPAALPVTIGALLMAALVLPPQVGASPFYACVKKGGTAHVFTKKTRCKKGETKISWNSQGPTGKDGADGKNGTNGANGTNGTSGAVAGFSVTRSVGEAIPFTSATAETPATIVSRTLPAGNFIVNAKTELLLQDSVTGGEAAVACQLQDTPSGGGAPSSDLAAWATPINFAFVVTNLAENTLPMTLAVSSPAHASTISIECWVVLVEAKGGTFKATANKASITAVQTTMNS